MTKPPPVLLLGISGPSCSGKTTLSRLLRDIYPHVSILHLDDFFLPDAQIPIHNGVQDWDCISALDIPSLLSTLQHIKSHGGAFPESLVSKEDHNAVGEHGVSEDVVEGWKVRVRGSMGGEEEKERDTRIVIVDGFLLFSKGMKEVREMFDVRLFLRTSYETVKTRREARKGYVTLEGFWEDPPGYVDQIVWPNYVLDHGFLFESGDVSRALDEKMCERLGILGMPKEGEGDMGVCLDWAAGVLEGEMKQILQQPTTTRW